MWVRWLGVVLLGLLSTGSVAGQNLVANGDFDVGVAGWEVLPLLAGMTGSVTLSWDPSEDALGRSDSGALLLEFEVFDPAGAITFVPLVHSPCSGDLEPSTTYLTGNAQRSDVTTPDLFTQVRFQQWETATCSGVPVNSPLSMPIGGPSYLFQAVPIESEATAQGHRHLIWTGTQAQVGGGSAARGMLLLDKAFTVALSAVQGYRLLIEVESQVGLRTQFLGVQSGGVSPYPSNFFWDFGDGKTSTEQNPTHVYSAPGSYLVTLMADSGYEQATRDLVVEVGANPSAVEIPTLSVFGLGVLFFLLALSAGWVLRRRQLS